MYIGEKYLFGAYWWTVDTDCTFLCTLYYYSS